MPSDSKSVKSVRSSRSTRSTRSRKVENSYHDNDYAMTSDDDSMPLKATFSHRSKRGSSQSHQSEEERSVNNDPVSDEEEEEEVELDNLEEDSTLRISSLLMSSKNLPQEEPPSSKAIKSTVEKTGEVGKGDATDNEDIGSESNQDSETPSRSRIIKKIETRAVRRIDASTVRMGDVISHLENALHAVKNLDNLNMLHQMEAWKGKATKAETKQEELVLEIESLKKEITTWQARTRRAEKKCERMIQSGKGSEKDKKSNSLGTSAVRTNHSLADDLIPTIMSEDAEVPKGPSSGLRTLLRGPGGVSFRRKWDRKRIVGIVEKKAEEHHSDGESTVAAREYVNQYLESNPKPEVVENEERDDSLSQGKAPNKRISTKSRSKPSSVITSRSSQSRRHSKPRRNEQQSQAPQASTLDDNDNSWVEMLSI